MKNYKYLLSTLVLLPQDRHVWRRKEFFQKYQPWCRKIKRVQGDQRPAPCYRKEMILNVLKEEGQTLEGVDAFSQEAAAGKCGRRRFHYWWQTSWACKNLLYRKASGNLRRTAGRCISKEFGGAAFVVNPPDVDEFQDVARVTGLKGVYRESRIHALNQKEIGIRFAAKQGKKYEDMNLIICHIAAVFL